MFPKVTLILGGVSSGKSAYGEKLVLSGGGSAVYLATAQALDDEMAAKIARHRAARASSWRTLEVPLALAAALDSAGADQAVLVDCATLWLSNQLLAQHDIALEQARLIKSLKSCAARVVVVSNEVGLGGVSGNEMARTFARAQGELNQQIAAMAGRVVLISAGLALVLKGAPRLNPP